VVELCALEKGGILSFSYANGHQTSYFEFENVE
jgi:hypothetical protein